MKLNYFSNQELANEHVPEAQENNKPHNLFAYTRCNGANKRGNRDPPVGGEACLQSKLRALKQRGRRQPHKGTEEGREGAASAGKVRAGDEHARRLSRMAREREKQVVKQGVAATDHTARHTAPAWSPRADTL